MRLYAGYFICFIILTIALSSCVKDITMDAEEDPVLAVTCILTDKPIQHLKLMYTKGASAKDAPEVPAATIVLTDLTEGKEAGRFSKTGSIEWQLEYAAIPLHRYRLDIAVQGHETVWAEQTMPDLPLVETVIFNPWQPDYKPLPVFEERVAPRSEYYRSHFPSAAARGMLYRAYFPYATIVRMERYNDETGEYEPVKKLCTDYPGVSNENLTGELRPWMEFEGVPGAHLQPTHWDWYLSQYPLHDSFLFLPASSSPSPVFFAVDDNQLYMTTSPEYSLDVERPAAMVYFSALSDDYYNYLKDAYHQYIGQIKDDLSVIYLRDNLYTNVQGGLGIFGAVTSLSIKWGPLALLYMFEDPDTDEA